MESENQENEISKKSQKGRPASLEDSTKVTVVLWDKQIHWLDTLTTEIRWKTKSALNRAQIIRAMISAIEESGIDLTSVKSEEETKKKILLSLNRND